MNKQSLLDNTSSDIDGKGIHVDVDHLYYSVKVPQEKNRVKKILSDVNFHLEPGSLTFLMGPSGSGKSTLLDLLSDRKKDGHWSGDILFNKAPRNAWFSRDSAYILQDDLHIATLTVRETIYFSASFQLTEGTSQEDINKRVDLLLDLMGLAHIQDSFVGDATHKGISGGQKKRLSIAVEMVALQKLIFLDEPTSGLDSTMALEVMRTVRHLANGNRTCISTIHQPSIDVFNFCDQVLLLCSGKLVYNGPAKLVVKYFTDSSLGYFYEAGKNPAEFIIEVGEGILKPPHRKTPLTIEELHDNFLLRKNEYEILSTFQAEKDIVANIISQKLQKRMRLHATTKFTQFKILVYRSLLAISRDRADIISQIVKNLATGLLIGILFYQQANTTTPLFSPLGVPNSEVTNISSLLFFSMMNTMISNVHAIPTLCMRNAIFKREVASFSYSVSPYWLAHSLTIIPMQFIGFCFNFPVAYFLCEFPNDTTYFFYFAVILFLSNLTSFYFAMYLAAATESEYLSLIAFPLQTLFLSTFAGYAITVNDVPPMWSWATYIDYIRWAFEGLMVNQWKKYDNNDYYSVLSIYGFENFHKYDSFWILFLAIGLFLLMVYLAMRPKANHLELVEESFHLEVTKTNESVTLPMGVEDNPMLQKQDLQTKLLTNNKEQEHVMIKGQGGGEEEIDYASILSFSDFLHTGTINEETITKGYTLTFYDLNYYIPVKKESHGITSSTSADSQSYEGKKQILHNVFGRAEPGDMIALIGSSGAGKSTLLDILANRKTFGEITGNIFINGERPSILTKNITAYVTQESILIDNLTVYETLLYAALLRFPEKMSMEHKVKRVRNMLDVLGLTHIENSLIGSEGHRGISGGQRKRVSIGVEIIHLPHIIFLDEPTTGLDSAIAYEVMSIVHNLATQNRTIICTIHQPSTQIFNLFSHVLLLSYGRVLYFGETKHIKDYFAQSIYEFSYLAGSNVSEYIISIASEALPTKDNQTISTLTLHEYFLHHSIYHTWKGKLPHWIDNDKNYYGPIVTKDLIQGRVIQTSLWYQIHTLLSRAILIQKRNYLETMSNTIRSIIVGLFYGSVYFHLNSGYDPTVYINRLSILFFSLMLMLMIHQHDIPKIQHALPLFHHERASGLYTVFSYMISELLLLIPLNMINDFLYTILMYTMVELNPRIDHFCFFFAIMWICDIIGLFICSIVSYLAPSTQVAMNIFPIIIFFSVAFEGFIIYLPEFPDWLSWGPDISYMRFAFQALSLNEFQNNEKLPLERFYISELGFDDLNKTQCFGYLMIFLFVHAILLYVAMVYANNEKR